MSIRRLGNDQNNQITNNQQPQPSQSTQQPQLSVLPAQIGMVADLQSLDLSANRITSTSPEVSTATGLPMLGNQQPQPSQSTQQPHTWVVLSPQDHNGTLSWDGIIESDEDGGMTLPLLSGEEGMQTGLFASNRVFEGTIGNQQHPTSASLLRSLAAYVRDMQNASLAAYVRDTQNVELVIPSHLLLNPYVRDTQNVGLSVNPNTSLSSIFKPFQNAASDATLSNLEFSFFEEDPQLSMSLIIWGRKLRMADDFTNAETRPHFATRVLSILQFSIENSEYLNGCLKVALLDATSSCADRATLPLNNLELQKKIMQSHDKSLESVLSLLKGVWATHLLVKCARDKVTQVENNGDWVDEIEVYLGLQVKLRERLQLPIECRGMVFFNCSKLTDADIDSAEREVKARLSNTDALVEFLVGEEIWKTKLTQEFSAEKERALKEVNDRMEKLFDESSSMRDADFDVKSDKINKEYQDAEKDWFKAKTLEILKKIG